MTSRFFSRWYTTPHRESPPREVCVPCAGGGEINGLTCTECGGIGYFDQHNPKPGG
jgi:hypothetical protein